MKDDELRPEENVDLKTREADTGYRAPRLYVAGKTIDLLRGGSMGSLEDFARRFKSADSG